LIYSVGSTGVLQAWNPATRRSITLGGTDLPPNPEEPFTVSRDGTRVAFESPCGCLYQHLPSPADDIRIVSPAGSDARKLPQPSNASDAQPTFSPNGTQVAFARSIYSRPDRSGAGRPRVMMQSVAGGAARDLGVKGDLPAWSPDGRWIAYRRTVTPTDSLPVYSLAVIPAIGGTPHVLADNLPDLDSFSWSPNSRELVFETVAAIRVVDLQGHITKLPLPHMLPGYSTPQWSPNGKAIAFGATSGQRGSAEYVYTIDADGTHLRKLA
jgi:Tol biopolymer transport system component